MKSRPSLLTATGAVLFLIAAGLPAQIAWRYGHTPLELVAVLGKLAPLNWAVLMGSIITAVLALRGSRALQYALPCLTLLTLWNNWLVARLQPEVSPFGVAALSTLALAASVAVLIHPAVRKIFANPTLRWWRTPVRKHINLKAKIRPVKGGEVCAMTYDLSESGAFIATDHAIWADQLRLSSRALEIGAHCSLRLDLNPYRALHCIAKVVRHAEARGQYPGGFALQFEGLSPEDRRALHRFLNQLREQAEAAERTRSGDVGPPTNRLDA